MSKKRRRSNEVPVTTQEVADLLFNFDLLKNRCQADVQGYFDMVSKLDNAYIGPDKNQPYILIDNGANILAVAHLDVVHPAWKHFGTVTICDDPYVFSAALDDRLGVFLLLDVLPLLGMKYDILLTTGEEQGKSSAAVAGLPTKGERYLWGFECDRAGDDVVRYQYNIPDLNTRLNKAGFNNIQHGSYTDICELDDIGVGFFNIGIGYYQNHEKMSHANLTVTGLQIMRLLKFYENNRDVRIEYDPKKHPVYPTAPAYDYSRGKWESDQYGYHPPDLCKPKLNLRKGDKVRRKNTQDVWEITSSSCSRTYAKGETIFEWWAKQPNGANSFVYKALLEDDIELVVDQAPTVSVDDRAALRRKCDGRLADMGTINARHEWEAIIFNGVELHSSYAFSSPDTEFCLGQNVYSPYGNGYIDCAMPCVPSQNEKSWWVRLEKVNEIQTYACWLCAESTLSPRNMAVVVVHQNGDSDDELAAFA